MALEVGSVYCKEGLWKTFHLEEGENYELLVRSSFITTQIALIVLYAVFGSSELQPWAEVNNDEEEAEAV